MNRRDFTRMAGLGAMAVTSLPLMAFESGGIPLGLCNHSLRDMRLNARQLVDYAIDHKLDSVLLNTFQGTAIGEGVLNFQIFTETLSRVSPGVPLQVETISNSARSIPFLNPGFWKAFPDLPAAEFADFLRLVNTGTPLELVLPPAGISQKEFDIDLQQSELLKSIDFLRELQNQNMKIKQ